MNNKLMLNCLMKAVTSGQFSFGFELEAVKYDENVTNESEPDYEFMDNQIYDDHYDDDLNEFGSSESGIEIITDEISEFLSDNTDRVTSCINLYYEDFITYLFDLKDVDVKYGDDNFIESFIELVAEENNLNIDDIKNDEAPDLIEEYYVIDYKDHLSEEYLECSLSSGVYDDSYDEDHSIEVNRLFKDISSCIKNALEDAFEFDFDPYYEVYMEDMNMNSEGNDISIIENDVEEFVSNWWGNKGEIIQDPSIEVQDSEVGFEYISPVIKFSIVSLKKLEEFLNELEDEGIESDSQTRRCGFHIHFSYPRMTQADLLWITCLFSINKNRDKFIKLNTKNGVVNLFSTGFSDYLYMDDIKEAFIEYNRVGDTIELYKKLKSILAVSKKYRLLNIHSSGTLEWRGPRDFIGDIEVTKKFIRLLWRFVIFLSKALDKKSIFGIKNNIFIKRLSEETNKSLLSDTLLKKHSIKKGDKSTIYNGQLTTFAENVVHSLQNNDLNEFKRRYKEYVNNIRSASVVIGDKDHYTINKDKIKCFNRCIYEEVSMAMNESVLKKRIKKFTGHKLDT
jgi:hypothetical protein